MPPIHYRVEAANRNTHLFQVTLTLTPATAQQVLRLPVWIPGSYLVREFSKSLQNLRMRQNKRTLAVAQIDKASWQADCKPGVVLQVQYEFLPYDVLR